MGSYHLETQLRIRLFRNAEPDPTFEKIRIRIHSFRNDDSDWAKLKDLRKMRDGILLHLETQLKRKYRSGSEFEDILYSDPTSERKWVRF